jgi:restriction system protein
MNPHRDIGSEWINPLELKGLFKGTKQQPEKGQFIDQRYIDYLRTTTTASEICIGDSLRN